MSTTVAFLPFPQYRQMAELAHAELERIGITEPT
jgi:hypothetical protein